MAAKYRLSAVLTWNEYERRDTDEENLDAFWYTTDRLLNSSNILSFISLLWLSAKTETACFGGLTIPSATDTLYCRSL